MLYHVKQYFDDIEQRYDFSIKSNCICDRKSDLKKNKPCLKQFPGWSDMCMILDSACFLKTNISPLFTTATSVIPFSRLCWATIFWFNGSTTTRAELDHVTSSPSRKYLSFPNWNSCESNTSLPDCCKIISGIAGDRGEVKVMEFFKLPWTSENQMEHPALAE